MFPDALENGIDFLLKEQQDDGSFSSLSSHDPENFAGAAVYRTVFSTALILSCLCNIRETPKLSKIKKKAADFLLTQKSEDWSFNYWTRKSKEAKTMPYPDDLDDTFCALSAIFRFDPKLINGSALAKIVALLTALEVEEGGPYRTWLAAEDAKKVWRDIDLAVNANIAYFLRLVDVDLPRVKQFIEKKIKSGKITSPYYPNPYPLCYFISRFYKGKHKKLLVDFLTSKEKDNYWGNWLNCALAVSALVNLGFAGRKLAIAVENLVGSGQKDGSWNPYGFCFDPAREEKMAYCGSGALTTAFCLEAVSKFENLNLKTKIGNQNSKLERKDTIGEKIHNKVVESAKQRFSQLDGSLTKQAVEQLKKILETNKSRQVTLTPYFFSQSLGQKHRQKMTQAFLVKLGTANLLGWLAYTIYDDFFDDEGEKQKLSVANFCLRELTTIFVQILPEKLGFRELFGKVMNNLESANFWEVTCTRFRPAQKIDLLNLQFPNWELTVVFRIVPWAMPLDLRLSCAGSINRKIKFSLLFPFSATILWPNS